MRRSHALALTSLLALGGCTQNFSEALGEITNPLPRRPESVPAPAPQPTQTASAPAPKAEPKAAPAPTQTAEPERRGGIFSQFPPFPGFGRGNREEEAPARTAQNTPPPAPERTGGGFRLPGFGGGGDNASAADIRPGTEDGQRSRGGFLPRLPEGADPITYRPVTLEGLAKGVKEDSLPRNIGIDITANVDARFTRQIVIDLRGGGGLAVSRREGDCIQILLPWQIDQERFDSGKYRLRGIYRRTWFDQEFVYEDNRYQMSCGDAYLFVRYIEKAP